MPFLLSLALLLLAWLLRCWHLGFYDFRGDEVFGVGYVQAPLGQVIGTLARGEPHPPLFYLLLRSWLPLAGEGEYALRWIAAAADTLAVALLFVLGRRLAGPAVGLGAALVITLAPYHLWNAQDARMYALATALNTAAVYWAWRLVVAEQPTRRAAALYAAALLLGLYTHYYTIYIAVLLNLFAAAALGVPLLAALRRQGWVPRRFPTALGIVAGESVRTPPVAVARPPAWAALHALSWRRWRLWVGAQVAVVLLYAPWVAFAWPTLTTYHGSVWSPVLADAVRDCIATFALGWGLPLDRARALVPLYAAGLLLGAGACLRLRRGGLALLALALWLLVPVGAVWLASRSRPIFDVRYLLEASPPFYLLLALPLRWWRPRANLGAALGSLAFLALLAPMVPSLYGTYAHPTDGRGHAYSDLARYLSGRATNADLIIINHLDPVVRFYLQRGGITTPEVTEPSARDLSDQALDAELTRATAGKAHLWLIPDDVGAWDRQHTVRDWLNRHAQPLGQEGGSFHVLEYQPWEAQTPVQVQFGDHFTLTGYRLQPPEPAAGQDWQVILFWRTSAAGSADEAVSVQLLDSGGTLVAQADGIPQSGKAPTSSWQPFETVPDPHVLHLPALPPGRYSLGVAVYPSGGGPRLAVPGVSGGLAAITTVAVR